MVYSGSLIRVEVQRWTGPERVREVVRHPGAVAVVALRGDDVILVRQLRESIGEPLLEIPAGLRDVDAEGPEEAARREVVEETGHLVTSLEPLGRIHTSPGFSDEVIEVYLGRVAPGGEPSEPGIEVVPMRFGRALEAVERGDITDGKSVAGLLLAGRRLSASA